MATMGGSLYAGVGDVEESQPGATNGAMILRNDTGAQTDWYQDGCKNFAMPPGTGIAACALAGDAPGNAASFLYASLSTRSNKATGTWTKGATQINLTYRCPSSRYSWVYDSTLGALVGIEASCSGNLLTLRSGALVASSPGGNDSLTLRTSGFSGIDSLYVAPLTNGTVSLNELVAGLWNHDYTGLWAPGRATGATHKGTPTGIRKRSPPPPTALNPAPRSVTPTEPRGRWSSSAGRVPRPAPGATTTLGYSPANTTTQTTS